MFIVKFKILKYKKLFINFIILLSFLFLSLLSSFLLIKSHIIYGGWDIQFHIKRILELKDSILYRGLFNNFSLNYFHGSSVMIMYPYINLIPSALLSFFIRSKIHLLYITFAFNIFFTFIISFYSNKSYTDSNFQAYFFSIMYSLSNMFITYYLIVSDLGISSTLTILPLIIFGFINIIKNNGWIELSLGMSLLLYSHILNFFIISLFLLLWLIINVTHINKEIIYKIVKSIILCILLTSVIWLPFLLFILNNFQNINMPFSLQLKRIPLKDFISGIYGSKNVHTIGFIPIITIFISILFYKRFNNMEKQMYWLSLVIILFSLFFPFENKLFKFLNIFQITYRFLIIPESLLVCVFSSIIIKYIFNKRLKIILYLFFIAIIIFFQLFMGQYRYLSSTNFLPTINYYLNDKSLNLEDLITKKNGYRMTSTSQFNKMLNIYHPSNNDYIPKSSIPISSYVNNNLGIYNNYYKIRVKRIGYDLFHFSNNNNITKLSLPIYIYNKENLHVYLNGRLIHNYANKNNLLTINNIHNNIKSNNRIYIKPSCDPFIIIGFILSSLGWLFVLILLVKKKIVNHINN